LKELALAKNKFEEVPEWIGSLKDLISLDLSKTGLKNFPISIFNLKNLEVLKI
jgi:Leucine-rich repeat (LRR) protein